MMKKWISLICLLALIVGCCSGCSIFFPEDTGGWELRQGDAMVLIAGLHANARRYTEEQYRLYIEDTLRKCVTIEQTNSGYEATVNFSVVISDGEPSVHEVTYREAPYSLRFERQGLSKLSEDIEDTLYVIREFLLSDSLRADDPEVDLAAAINEAALILRNTPNVNKKHLVIWDTGIVTKGYLNMNPTELDIQSASVDSVIESLSPGAFQDLDGIEVSFYGLGNVASGQTDMGRDTVFQTRLEDFWTAYFAKCGVQVEMNYFQESGTAMIYDAVAPNSYPAVSNVPFVFSENSEIIIIDEKEDGKTEVTLDEPVTFQENEINFEPGCAEFKKGTDPVTVMRSYQSVWDALKESNQTIYVVGSIAKVKPTSNNPDSEVSEERAAVVKEMIKVHFGIPADRIVAVNAGTTVLSWRDAIEFPDGTEASKDLEAQAKNRVVGIILEGSKEEAELRDLGLIS